MLSLSACPDAILINVWHHLLGDLHTFIAFAQTCRRLRHLSEQDDNIWRSACFVSGFGRPLRRGNAPARDMPYRRLARSIVSHGAVCEIRSCIKANACFADHHSRWAYTRTRPLHPDHPLDFHPLYFYLHFSQSYGATSQSRMQGQPHTPTPSPSPSPTPPAIHDSISILLTQLPTFPESRYAQYGPLCAHPNASCAFATFPPVDRLEFENGQGDVFMVVENPEGCTVLDVNRALAELIPFDDQHLEFALAHYQELAFTSGLSLPQFADAVFRDRGFLDDHEYPFLQHIVAHF
ncbi:uncharacterized protein TRAVEDRAFT_40786 [Trametes versicolor FP-101664 SS1]|uniref:F-box domain-containing protein n=1 Tax=Trametes versicolor (strain FP-101664) TaxID=717944 RepID=R7S7K1_TRAVS|nr:uncharacterized protein TRAVEDRAFT_40786 [Trametes versicolor FP-101664 SS1]EIW52033.1 hypothetical protein TRAVEDRAFT_40786 [Trametes versicolor FP-101664 SS1]